MTFAHKLCDVERDRVTAAEICIDECLTILDRHGQQETVLYSRLRALSDHLDRALLAADGPVARRARLTLVRSALTAAFPMADDDLAASEGG